MERVKTTPTWIPRHRCTSSLVRRWVSFNYRRPFLQGCQENTDSFVKNPPPWSAFRSSNYGFSQMQVHNKTHLYFEQIAASKVRPLIPTFLACSGRSGGQFLVDQALPCSLQLGGSTTSRAIWIPCEFVADKKVTISSGCFRHNSCLLVSFLINRLYASNEMSV
jgi:hypothetical protein